MSDSKSNINYIINDSGAIAILCKQWISKQDADTLCDKLRNELKFETYPIEIYGKIVNQPRKQYAFGDINNDKKFHSYSGTSIGLHDWTPEIKQIRDRLSKETGIKLNSCLLNEYATGKQYIGYHSDREAAGINDVVIIVSLGGPRDFYFKRKSDKKVIKCVLDSGDSIAMAGKCQELYQHSLPKRTSHVNYRLSLSFRNLMG